MRKLRGNGDVKVTKVTTPGLIALEKKYNIDLLDIGREKSVDKQRFSIFQEGRYICKTASSWKYFTRSELEGRIVTALRLDKERSKEQP